MYVATDEHPFGSTTWVAEPDKIRPPARATASTAARKGVLLRLARRDARRPLPVVWRLRGGPECWVEIKSRGRVYRFPGHLSVYDALMRITSGPTWDEP